MPAAAGVWGESAANTGVFGLTKSAMPCRDGDAIRPAAAGRFDGVVHYRRR